jgi:hypothetical protein
MAKTEQNVTQPSDSIKHLALLHGNSDVVSGIMASLQYEGLAVIGAVPIDHDARPSKNKNETEDYLLGVITEMVTKPNSAISNIHLLRLPCNMQLDANYLVSELTKRELGCNLSNIRVETEGGCRAFLEESCSLIPSSVSEGEVSELRKGVEGHIPILVSKGDSYVHAVGEADLETGDQGSGYVSPKSRLEDVEDRLSEVCSQLYISELERDELRSDCQHLRASIKCLYVSPKSRLEDVDDRLSEVCSQLYISELERGKLLSECQHLRASIKCLAEEWDLF